MYNEVNLQKAGKDKRDRGGTGERGKWEESGRNWVVWNL